MSTERKIWHCNKKQEPSNNGDIRAGGVTQEGQHLPGKCKALSSNPSAAKKNFKDTKEGGREGGEEK
jgi:hypothetical protein